MATATTISRFEELLFSLVNLVLVNADVAAASFEEIVEQALFAAGHVDPNVNHVNQLRVSEAIRQLLLRIDQAWTADRESWITHARANFAAEPGSEQREAARALAVLASHRLNIWQRIVNASSELISLCEAGEAVRVVQVLSPEQLDQALREAGIVKRPCAPPKSKLLLN